MARMLVYYLCRAVPRRNFEMPFYEYRCDACDRQFEVYHGINEKPEMKCETCSGPVRKVLFPPSVIFKGGGFYATEYGKSTHNNPKKSSSDEAKRDSKDSNESKDSK